MSRALVLLLVPSVALCAPAPATSPSAVAAAPAAADLRPYFAGSRAMSLLRKEDWPGAARAFHAYLEEQRALAPKQRDHLEDQARFLEGYALLRGGQPAEAAPLFDQLARDKSSLLHDYDLLYAARALLETRPAAALERARAVDAASPLDAEARFVRAEALRKLARAVEAVREYRAYLDAYPGSWREPEVRVRIAGLLEARGQDRAARAEAIALYRAVYVHFPTETWAREARDRLRVLEGAEFALDGHEQLARGLALFDEMRNADSEAALRAALASGALDATDRCVAGYHLAQSVFKARERARAAPLFDEAVELCTAQTSNGAAAAAPAAAGSNGAAASDPAAEKREDLLAKSLYQGARCHAAREEYGAALSRFARLEADHPNHSYADDARLREAEILAGLVDRLGAAPGANAGPRRPEPILADWDAIARAASIAAVAPVDRARALHERERAILASIPEAYPTGDQGGEALFRLAFDAFRRGDLDEARAELTRELARYPREDGWWEAGRTLYWLGRVAALQHKDEEASARFTAAARDYPLSYYALQALNRLRERAPDVERALVSELERPRPTEADLAFRFAPNPVYASRPFRTGVELARLGLGAEARRELSAAGIHVPERRAAARAWKGTPADEELLWAAAVLYDQAGEWSLSHAIPRHVLTDYARRWPTGEWVKKWRLSFPRGYEALVVENAQKNGQPVALEFAIIREESAWNPLDESFANAIGLTQLTADPAKRFALGLPHDREALRDPVINVTIGARELGDVWKKAGGIAPLAIASYNAGEGAVRRWLAHTPPGTDMDAFIEAIPYDETRGYTKRVLGSYFAYHFLWDEGDEVPPLGPSVPARM